MEIETIQKYIDKKVYLILKSGFKYKIILRRDCVKGTTVSFLDKFGVPVDFDLSEIAFITISKLKEKNKKIGNLENERKK